MVESTLLPEADEKCWADGLRWEREEECICRVSSGLSYFFFSFSPFPVPSVSSLGLFFFLFRKSRARGDRTRGRVNANNSPQYGAVGSGQGDDCGRRENSETTKGVGADGVVWLGGKGTLRRVKR